MLRFDDQFPIHRKVNGLTDAGFRLHVEALFWCARNLTDGFIAQEDLGVVSRYRRPEGYVAECVGREAWHRVEAGVVQADCAECHGRYEGALKGDGWLIHGYFDWQQPRSKVLQIREERKKAGQRGGVRSGQSRRGDKPAGRKGSGSKSQANAKQVAERSVEPQNPLGSNEPKGGRAPAAPGAALAPDDPRHSPLHDRPHPAAPPPDLTDVRARLADASRKARADANRRTGAFDELRRATDPKETP